VGRAGEHRPRLLGAVFAPLAWTPWACSWERGADRPAWLLGVKLVLTEFTAFIQLGEHARRGAR
jgi:nucleoside permease NupC